MSDSAISRLRKAFEEHVIALIVVGVTTVFGTVWAIAAPGVYRRLLATLGERGLVALLMAFFVVTVWALLGWRAEKKKEKPFFERLVPVPNGGYSIDPKNGEAVCPRCATEERKSYMLKVGGNYYCQACKNAVKGVAL